jgi:hypothetical protein
MKSDDSETTVRNDDGATAVTRDNPRFLGLTMDDGDAPNGDVMIAKDSAKAEFAVTCKLEPSDTFRAYVEAGIAPATRRAYKTDLEHFRAWGGNIPTTDLQLAAYLAEQATTLKVWLRSPSLIRLSACLAPSVLPWSGRPCGVCGVNTGQHSVRRPRFSARTSLSFSGRWEIGSRTSEIEPCC